MWHSWRMRWELRILEEPWPHHAYNNHRFHILVLCTKLVVFAALLESSYKRTLCKWQGQGNDCLEAANLFHWYNILLESFLETHRHFEGSLLHIFQSPKFYKCPRAGFLSLLFPWIIQMLQIQIFRQQLYYLWIYCCITLNTAQLSVNFLHPKVCITVSSSVHLTYIFYTITARCQLIAHPIHVSFN